MHQVNLNVIEDQKAVTLVELMVVISIIAIMGAIASPTFFNYRSTLKLRTAARELASDTRYARQLAVSQNNSYSLCFDTTKTSQYSIFNTNDCTGTPVKTIDIAQTYSGVAKSGGATLVFSPLGTVTPPNTVFTLNEADISQTKTVTVSGAGNVSIQ
jgi:prepilin-type N-terminal cleavage/methylation domain-containing protein